MKIVKLLVYLLACMGIGHAEIVWTQQELHYIKENKEVKVAMLPNTSLYSFYENGVLRGYAYDLLQLLSKKSDVKFSYEVDSLSVNLQKFNENSVELLLADFSKILNAPTNVHLLTIKETIPFTFALKPHNYILFSILNKSLQSLSYEEKAFLDKKWFTQENNGSSKELVALNQSEKTFLLQNSFECVTTSKWPPFTFKQNGKFVGIAHEFWALIKEKTLINATCKEVYNFKSVLELIRNKQSDLTISTAITEDKLQYSKFSIPYVSYPIAIATTMDKQYISDTTSLNGKTVAVGKSYSAYHILKDKYPQINFIEVNHNYEALKLLSKGDVFAVIDILPVLSHMIVDLGFKNLKISGVTEFNFDVRVMVREELEKLIPIINKGINAITFEEKEAIKNRWLSVKYENLVDYKELWQISVLIVLIILIFVYRHYMVNQHNKKLQEANKEIEENRIALRKKTDELAKQKELFEKIYYESSDGIFVLRLRDRKIVDCNNASFTLLGYSNQQEFMRLSSDDFYPLLQPNGVASKRLVEQKIEETIKNGSATFELQHKTKRKETIWLEVVFTLISIDYVGLVHVVWRDIQKRKELEIELNQLTNNLEEKTKQLIQQGRLAQMGEMISMIAHQWRQPLTAISATTNNLLLRMMINQKLDDKELKEEINLISEYSLHLSTTIDDFRNFFKSDKEKTQTTLETIVNNSLNIVKGSFELHGIKIEKSFECNQSLVFYATELSQVILNIIKNSEDAILENSIKQPFIAIKTYLDKEHAHIEIRDNAGGIPENILPQIFDPYFSTKKKKDGTGLGLYISKIIVHEHCNGLLEVQNYQNGVKFRICLPLVS